MGRTTMARRETVMLVLAGGAAGLPRLTLVENAPATGSRVWLIA